MTVLDLLTVAVLAVVGVRLFEAARTSVGAHRKTLGVVQGLRWRHFLRAIPIVALIVATAGLLIQLPVLSFGWWSAIGGEGNPVVGVSDRDLGIAPVVIPLFFIGLLIVIVARRPGGVGVPARRRGARNRREPGALGAVRPGPRCRRHPHRRRTGSSIGGSTSRGATSTAGRRPAPRPAPCSNRPASTSRTTSRSSRWYSCRCWRCTRPEPPEHGRETRQQSNRGGVRRRRRSLRRRAARIPRSIWAPQCRARTRRSW